MAVTETDWFADRLREERESRGLSQEKMARLLDVGLKSYTNWEMRHTFPRFGEFQRLCVILDWPHAASVDMGL